jgi:hypothetical protein
MPEAADPSQWIFTLFPKVILKPFLREPTHRATRANESPFENLPLPFHQTVPPDILIRPQESLNRLNETQPHTPGRPRNPTGASIAGEQHQPLAHSAKTSPSPSLPASAGPVPQSPGTHDPAPESVPPLLSTISRPTQNTRKTPSPESPTRHPPTTHSRGGRGTGPERALEAIKPLPSRTARKPHPTPSFPASAGPIPRSPVEALIPSASPGTLPPQNR